MLTFYHTSDGRLTQSEELKPGCWVSLIAPTEGELGLVRDALAKSLTESGFKVKE